MPGLVPRKNAACLLLHLPHPTPLPTVARALLTTLDLLQALLPRFPPTPTFTCCRPRFYPRPLAIIPVPHIAPSTLAQAVPLARLMCHV